MGNRKFRLPNINELSKEQDAALARPKEGQHLIVGGPGTGKTVMALLRALQYHREGDAYVFLVWNHLLRQASEQLADWPLKIETWESWFIKQFENATQHKPPRINNGSDRYQPIDWEIVLKMTGKIPTLSKVPYLVIDEGQDMPPEFYRSMVNLGFEHYYVVADQNQQIKDANSSRKDIESALDIATKDVVELRRNYRNSTPVANLARTFYTGDPASPPPEIPNRPGDAALLVTYSQDQFAVLCRRVILRVDRDPSKLVGVLSPNNEVRETYVDGLRSVSPQNLDHGFPRVDTFNNTNRPNIRFDDGGIIVINAQNCKGLEFDEVVLADIDQHIYWKDDSDRTRKLFYVMVARALAGWRHLLILLRRNGSGDWLNGFLPEEPDVLQRLEL